MIGMATIKFHWRALPVAALLALAACGELPTNPTAESDATPQAGYGRAFGRIAYTEGGKEVVWGFGATSSNLLTLYLRSNRTGEMQSLDLEGTGYFVWPLTPGEYTILGFRTQQAGLPGTRTSRVRLMATFSVPQAGEAVYLGELQVEADRGRYGFRVADKYGEGGLARFEARPDAGKFRTVKGLVALEPPLGKYKRVSGICIGTWGVECTEYLRGVEPVSPEGAGHSFPVVATLAPVLEWKPSTRAGVTYDVAVFDSHLTFPMPGPTPHAHRIRGAVVAYAEGLTEPRFAPPGLMRDKTYEWSVRLREADTVSTWSTTSYSTFIIVAASRGSGQFFGFATPK